MHTIQNGLLRVIIDALGAELKSVYHQQHNLEYLWQADPAFWAKSSPVLFPIVGQLKGNQYRHQGAIYSLPRHGFAREKEFQVSEQTADAITFSLHSNAATLEVYPFPFVFSISYRLVQQQLEVTYQVQNRGTTDMYFSVGGHPAFRVPLAAGTAYDDYYLLFSQAEEAGRWPISPEGLIEKTPQPLLQGRRKLPLTKDLFAKDAIVSKDLRSTAVQLLSDKTAQGLEFSFTGFPFFGIWAAPGADFVCLEPWCGLADSVDASGELKDKEGINRLAPDAHFSVSWTVRFF